MKRPSAITNIESKLLLPASLLENHVNNMHYADNPLKELRHKSKLEPQGDFENINWCSEQLSLNGTIEINFTRGNKNQHYSHIIPITAAFLVVCTKGSAPGFKLTWSCSLT